MIIIDKINYKLINFALILIIFFFIIITKNTWINIILIIKKILLPIVISFSISYFLCSITKLVKLKQEKYFIIKILVLILFIGMFSFLIYLSLPLLINQVITISSSLMGFNDSLFNKGFLQDISFLKPLIDNFLKQLINNLSNNTFSFLFKSIDIVSDIILIAILSIYFLFKMDDINKKIKYYASKNKKIFIVLKNINYSLNNYLKSLFIIIIIETIEYSLIYFLIGHPNFLLIGFLAGITTIIPFFGALFTNIIALVVASSNIKLFILSSLVILIMPIFDSYVIDPKIYHKKININPIETIISIIVCSNLFGMFGIIIAIPCLIIVRELINVYFNKYIR